MTDPLQAGVGAFGDLGTHKLDLLLFLMGDTARLEAVTATFSRPNPDATRRVRSAARRSCASPTAPSPPLRRAGWIWWSPRRCSSADRRDMPSCATLPACGTTIGTTNCFCCRLSVVGAAGKAPWTDLPARLPRPLEQFIDAVVHGERSHLVSVREAAYSSYVMEVISKAAAERRWLPVDPGAL